MSKDEIAALADVVAILIDDIKKNGKSASDPTQLEIALVNPELALDMSVDESRSLEVEKGAALELVR